MSYIRHLKSPQDLFDSFDKEIFDQVKEVCVVLGLLSHDLSTQIDIYKRV